MNSSQFLRLSRKGGDRFEWTGDIQHLDKFFAALHYKGIWSEPKGEGNPHKFTNKDFTCTWYATKKSLLIQGKKSMDLVVKLKHVVDHPVPLTIAEDESKHLAEPGHRASADDISMTKSHSSEKECKDGYRAPEVKEEKTINEEEFRDGILPGKVITNLLEFRMTKWVKEGARITIATPFIDSAGLKFILSCISSERALDKIYTREICGWNNKKIDKVIAETELSGQWFVNKVVSIKKTLSFHGKFLAGEHENKVELILTSCNFTSEHYSPTNLKQ